MKLGLPIIDTWVRAFVSRTRAEVIGGALPVGQEAGLARQRANAEPLAALGFERIGTVQEFVGGAWLLPGVHLLGSPMSLVTSRPGCAILMASPDKRAVAEVNGEHFRLLSELSDGTVVSTCVAVGPGGPPVTGDRHFRVSDDGRGYLSGTAAAPAEAVEAHGRMVDVLCASGRRAFVPVDVSMAKRVVGEPWQEFVRVVWTEVLFWVGLGGLAWLVAGGSLVSLALAVAAAAVVAGVVVGLGMVLRRRALERGALSAFAMVSDPEEIGAARDALKGPAGCAERLGMRVVGYWSEQLFDGAVLGASGLAYGFFLSNATRFAWPFTVARYQAVCQDPGRMVTGVMGPTFAQFHSALPSGIISTLICCDEDWDSGAADWDDQRRIMTLAAHDPFSAYERHVSYLREVGGAPGGERPMEMDAATILREVEARRWQGARGSEELRTLLGFRPMERAMLWAGEVASFTAGCLVAYALLRGP